MKIEAQGDGLRISSVSELGAANAKAFHRWVFEAFENRHRNIEVEAIRLLLNRCSGLLLAQKLLMNKSSLTTEESDFIGDAFLVAEGQYHWDCLERGQRLRALDATHLDTFAPRIVQHHAAGIEFKLHPTRTAKSAEEFRAEHRELAQLAMHEWLAIENLRLNSSFSTLRDYSFSSIHKCADTARWRNILLNIRTFGAGATLDSHSPRYPRERLFNALPLLLGNEEAIAELDTQRHLQELLCTQAQDWSGLVAAYNQVWSCYA